MSRASRMGFRASCEQLEDRKLLSTLTPTQMRHAYGMDAISFAANGGAVAGTGAGQTIAVVVAFHNPFLADQVSTFNAAYGLPDTDLRQVNLAGARTNEGWAQEEAMDVQWAHVMAPEASILVVEAASDSAADLMTAVNYARQQPGVSVVSMSWGSPEFRGQRNYDRIFTTPPGHNGVTFVTASGDSGARFGAQWPSSSPNVVSVGGTTLQVDARGNILSETAWSGSGGGRSVFTAEPQYQASVQSSRRRTTPDIALDGDPATGVSVYVVSPMMGIGYWTTLGGTSLSAQLFAGMLAVANQGRSLLGLGTLDGPGQTLPYLYAAPSSDYRDVTVGFNGYRAAPGYDMTTGRGAPVGPALVADLARGVVVPVVAGTFRPRTLRARRALAGRFIAATASARYSIRDAHQAVSRLVRISAQQAHPIGFGLKRA